MCLISAIFKSRQDFNDHLSDTGNTDIAMASTITDSKAFLESFKAAGGWFDEETFGLSQFDQMGWGGVALKDIPASLRHSEICQVANSLGAYSVISYPAWIPPDTFHI